MNTSKTIINKTAFFVFATGLVAVPVSALAQQKAVEEYRQYLENRDNPAQVSEDKQNPRFAIERLDQRIERLELQYRIQASDDPAHRTARRAPGDRSN